MAKGKWTNPFAKEPEVGCTIHYMDASALIKFFHDEEGSERVRNHVDGCLANRKFFELVFRTTSLCFAETMSFFKMKARRKEITKDEYSNISRDIMNYVSSVFEIQEPPLHVFQTFIEQVMEGVDKYGLDVSDIFQLIAIRWMRDEHLENLQGGTRCILVSADNDLIKAARAEGIRAWNVLSEPTP